MFTRRMSVAVTVVIVALVTLGLVASALPGFAAPSALPGHARLLGTTPEDGASVESADEVVLSFSEEVDATFLQVRVEGPGGDEADGDPGADGRDVVQPLVADLPAGEHTVTYRVVSVDGHPVSGSMSFTTTASPAEASPTATPSASASPTATAGTASTPTATTPSVAAAPTASDDSGGVPTWVLVGLPLLLLLVLVGGGLAMARGRKEPGDGDPDGAS
ncbi:copper resistance protein CopC [Phycicoccus sp. CSK15P-2]|uniref:copper resistance CopC family protein n=1 Tax=Phycicoccus sp. CSK15P-2 TaxID=2807627 RepID=UPI00195227EE|nr:copper resistance CopC family protein [Phycicoccus sp. CSK15P-2]MBM6404294.1 copper resistance protein CopC [Phycicoccus sp. CSK15P-2]